MHLFILLAIITFVIVNGLRIEFDSLKSRVWLPLSDFYKYLQDQEEKIINGSVCQHQ